MKTASLTTGLHHGDCLELLPQVADNSVDLITTDPPYLAKYKDRDGRELINDDRTDWLLPAYREMFRVLKPNRFCVTTYGWHQAHHFFQAWQAAGFRPVGHFVWTKRYTSKTGYTKARHEMAYLLAKGNPKLPKEAPQDVLPWRYSGNKLHPTQTPVMAWEPLIEAYSKPGETVLDPFAGSASVALAAWRKRRKFLGMEMDEQYFTAARKRMRAYVAAIRQQEAEVKA